MICKKNKNKKVALVRALIRHHPGTLGIVPDAVAAPVRIIGELRAPISSGLGRTPKSPLLSHSIYMTAFPTQSALSKIISTLKISSRAIKLPHFESIQFKMPTSTSPQPISIKPISVPSSGVDFGAIIENVDLENLTGR